MQRKPELNITENKNATRSFWRLNLLIYESGLAEFGEINIRLFLKIGEGEGFFGESMHLRPTLFNRILKF